MKYRVIVSTTEERTVEAPNAFEAAVRAANGDRTATIEDVKAARGRPRAQGNGSTSLRASKTRKKMTPQARAKMLKNLEKARAARKKNIRTKKATTKKRVTR